MNTDAAIPDRPESLATAELAALESIYRQLAPFPPVTRERIVTYLCRVLEIEVEL